MIIFALNLPNILQVFLVVDVVDKESFLIQNLFSFGIHHFMMDNGI